VLVEWQQQEGGSGGMWLAADIHVPGGHAANLQASWKGVHNRLFC
jgi:hypothetical protein